MVRPCFADKYYVFIDKIGKVDKGEEAGQNQKGDVICIAPFTSQYKPTKAEKGRYQIIVVDLTQEEIQELIECEVDQDDNTVRARKRKVDVQSLNLTKQEQEIDKTLLFQKIIIKPSILITQ